MLDEMSMPKLKTKTIIPERMIIDQANRDLFSPIKVTDDVDLNGFKQMSAATPAGNVPQLKLKIPLNRSSTEKPLKLKKVNKDENYIPDEIDSEEDDGAKKSNRAKKSIFKK